MLRGCQDCENDDEIDNKAHRNDNSHERDPLGRLANILFHRQQNRRVTSSERCLAISTYRGFARVRAHYRLRCLHLSHAARRAINFQETRFGHLCFPIHRIKMEESLTSQKVQRHALKQNPEICSTVRSHNYSKPEHLSTYGASHFNWRLPLSKHFRR